MNIEEQRLTSLLKFLLKKYEHLLTYSLSLAEDQFSVVTFPSYYNKFGAVTFTSAYLNWSYQSYKAKISLHYHYSIVANIWLNKGNPGISLVTITATGSLQRH